MKDKITQIFRNSLYREYLRLLLLYGKVPRYQGREIKFLNYKIYAPDCLSFIYQFKEIFVKKYYLFSSESAVPVVYDCGANIGISVLYIKSVFPNSKIKAFEADKSVAEILSKNLTTNGVMDVAIIPKAVWIHNNGVEFYTDKADAGSIYGKENKILADSVRLKDLVEQEEKIDFLKLDIEGAETAVIEDLGSHLMKVDNLFIEYHSLADQKQKLDKMLFVLSENGFRYFINSVYDKQMPFLNTTYEQNPVMDLQLNIFAYR